jgi:hypothetical protein
MRGTHGKSRTFGSCRGDELQARNDRLIGDQLAPPRRARSVRVRDGKALVTDGPFAETEEAVGGFDVIECGGLDEAVEIAAAHPVAAFGTIEVRSSGGTRRVRAGRGSR